MTPSIHSSEARAVDNKMSPIDMRAMLAQSKMLTFGDENKSSPRNVQL